MLLFAHSDPLSVPCVGFTPTPRCPPPRAIAAPACLQAELGVATASEDFGSMMTLTRELKKLRGESTEADALAKEVTAEQQHIADLKQKFALATAEEDFEALMQLSVELKETTLRQQERLAAAGFAVAPRAAPEPEPEPELLELQVRLKLRAGWSCWS